MTLEEKNTLLDLINEFHWYATRDGRCLYVFIDLCDFEEFSKYFREKHPSLFDDDGIECYWKGSYICIPNFEDVLDFIGLSEEEIHEMFEED